MEDDTVASNITVSDEVFQSTSSAWRTTYILQIYPILGQISIHVPVSYTHLDVYKRQVLNYAKENPELLDELLRTKRLPITKLSQGSGVDRKTLERHRKYMVAMLLILSLIHI